MPALAMSPQKVTSLGRSGTLDNVSFEVVGPGVFGGLIADAGIDQCVHLVTDDLDGGCGFPTALIGDLSAAIAYCASAGIFFSPVCDRQQTAASYLQDYCDAANLAICWNDGLLKFIPYGDTPLAGNGFDPIFRDLTPVYDLDDDDFIAEGDEPPLKIEREDPETLTNIIEIDILDRSLGYNTHPIKDRDSSLVFRFGQIPASPRKYDFICDPGIWRNRRQSSAAAGDADRCVERQLQARRAIRTAGEDGHRHREQPEVGWVKKPFRLKESDEDPETGETQWTAEPVMWGSCSATLYPEQAPGGGSTQKDAAPGSILPPIIFEAPDPLIPQGEYEVWLGLCGASLANWERPPRSWALPERTPILRTFPPGADWAQPHGRAPMADFPGAKPGGKRVGCHQYVDCGPIGIGIHAAEWNQRGSRRIYYPVLGRRHGDLAGRLRANSLLCEAPTLGGRALLRAGDLRDSPPRGSYTFSGLTAYPLRLLMAKILTGVGAIQYNVTFGPPRPITVAVAGPNQMRSTCLRLQGVIRIQLIPGKQQ